MSTYINLTQDFYDKYQMYGNEHSLLHIVRTLNGLLVADPNTINDFPELFEEYYDFIEVDTDFYNKYGGMVLIPEKFFLFVRKTKDGKNVIEEKMKDYFGTVAPQDQPILQYKLTDLDDLYIELEWEDFDHSNDIY